mmetsp:Transcript_15919/g.47481  ORF Transcript_15919/g.47481 Transcript_15919/m.47481 type:complete len:213 (+) Transcript_15919:123-761(+)
MCFAASSCFALAARPSASSVKRRGCGPFRRCASTQLRGRSYVTDRRIRAPQPLPSAQRGPHARTCARRSLWRSEANRIRFATLQLPLRAASASRAALRPPKAASRAWSARGPLHCSASAAGRAGASGLSASSSPRPVTCRRWQSVCHRWRRKPASSAPRDRSTYLRSTYAGTALASHASAGPREGISSASDSKTASVHRSAAAWPDSARSSP